MSKEMSPHYEVMGTGEITIVFIHYFGGDAGSWRWLAKRLKRKYTCILLNLPGFGETTPLKEPSIYSFSKYINTCVEYLNLENYILCGHSMGAKLALYAAKLTTGKKPSKIILIAPSPPTVEDMDEDEKKRMLIHPDRNAAIETVKGATRKKLGEKRFQYALNSQLRIDDATWDWWLQEGMKNNIASRISDVEIPTFIIFSKQDPVIAVDTVYNEVLPYVYKPKLIQFSKSGHLIPMEVPRKLARIFKKIV